MGAMGACDLRFRAAIFKPKPILLREFSRLGSANAEMLAIAIVRFWCAKPRCSLGLKDLSVSYFRRIPELSRMLRGVLSIAGISHYELFLVHDMGLSERRRGPNGIEGDSILELLWTTNSLRFQVFGDLQSAVPNADRNSLECFQRVSGAFPDLDREIPLPGACPKCRLKQAWKFSAKFGLPTPQKGQIISCFPFSDCPGKCREKRPQTPKSSTLTLRKYTHKKKKTI